MKKLLSLLGVLSVVASSSASVVACGGGSKSDNGTADLTDVQKQMVDGAEFMTKLILAGRHENLNYNVNEVLSSYITPISTLSYMPQIYNYKGQQIDLSKAINTYKTMLAPNMAGFDRDNYAGFYASYVMGMYSDDFYDQFNNEDAGANYFRDSMDADGNFGINKNTDDNALGYANGLNADLKLADDAERKELAWGIQDTGPLTNYLLDKGFDGSNPDSSSGTGNPNNPAQNIADGKEYGGGSNGSGYLFYNSVTARGSSKIDINGKDTQTDGDDDVKHSSINASLNKKFGDTGYSLGDQYDQALAVASTKYDNAVLNNPDGTTTKYGEVGAKIAKTGANLNVNGYAASYMGYINSITKSQTGAEIVSQMSNLFVPMLMDDGSSKSSQNIAAGLINKTMNAFWEHTTTATKVATLVPTVATALHALDDSVAWEDQFGDVRHKIVSNASLASQFWFQDKSPAEDYAAKASSFFEQLIASYNKADNDAKKAFCDVLFNEKDGILTKAQTTVISQMGYSEFQKVIGTDGTGGINLLNLVGRVASAESKYTDVFNKVNEDFEGKPYKKLSSSQKMQMAQDLGWSEDGFKNDSFLEHAYATLKDESIQGVTEFHTLLTAFANITSTQMEPIHESVMQYMTGTGENSWTDKDVSVSVPDNEQKGGKMTFTLDYNGIGDSRSIADQQTKKIDDSKLDNFNPYQTKYEYQESELSDTAKSEIDQARAVKSGTVLGKEALGMSEDDLKAYDGTGMLSDMEKVHHYYKVEWTNVSKKEHEPYWVITAIHSYNDNDEEFYNIY